MTQPVLTKHAGSFVSTTGIQKMGPTTSKQRPRAGTLLQNTSVASLKVCQANVQQMTARVIANNLKHKKFGQDGVAPKALKTNRSVAFLTTAKV